MKAAKSIRIVRGPGDNKAIVKLAGVTIEADLPNDIDHPVKGESIRDEASLLRGARLLGHVGGVEPVVCV
jgi:hypothetical protein